MSRNRIDLRSDGESDPALSRTKHTGSKSVCYDNLNESDSKAESDSRTRKAAVGLRGWRGQQHTPAERLAARTIKTPTCWIVQGYRNPNNGYVQISSTKGQPPYFAHRLAYELANGPIPKGLKILHSCDVPQCVNPAHLSVGTQRDNILDSIRKGRYNVFGRQKLNATQVRIIREMSKAGRLQKDIAAQFQIARHTVSGIVNKKSWTHLEAE